MSQENQTTEVKEKEGAWCAGCGDTWVTHKSPSVGWCCSYDCAGVCYD